MNLLLITLTCFINIMASFWCTINIHKWLTDAGIDFVAGNLFSLFNLIGCSFFLVLVLTNIGSALFSFDIINYVNGFCAISGFVLIFLGSLLILQPQTFFIGYSDVWAYYINTPRTKFVQNRLGCCGFNRINEFKDDTCNISEVSASCLKKIIMEFSPDIQVGGSLLFIHGLSFGLVIYFGITELKIYKIGDSPKQTRTPSIQSNKTSKEESDESKPFTSA